MDMIEMRKHVFYITIVLITVISCNKEKGEMPTVEETVACDTINAKYNNEIENIINTACATSGCHNATGQNPKLSDYDKVKAAVDGGRFELRVFNSPSAPMPPSFITRQLSAEEKDKLRCWLDAGAPNN